MKAQVRNQEIIEKRHIFDRQRINEINKETAIDNKLELLRYTAEVQSRIKRDISSDFVMAKLDPQDRNGIIETTVNAYFFRRMMKLLKDRSYKWEWDDRKRIWNKRKLRNNEITYIEARSKATFDSYMMRCYMTSILNRNVDSNHILNKLTSYQDDIDDAKMDAQATDLLDKTKNLLKPNT